MNILLSFQSYQNQSFYDELNEFAKNDDFDNIYITSSLMHDLDEKIIQEYSGIQKVKFIESNTLFSFFHFNKTSFSLSKNFIEKEELNININLLSSYRWLPIGKKYENDKMSFSMIFHYDIYNFWNSFFVNNDIHSVILLNDEHSSLDSILIKSAKNNNVKNILTSSIIGAIASKNEEYFAFYDSVYDKYLNLTNLKTEYVYDTKLDIDSCDFKIFSDEYKTSNIKKMAQLLSKLNILLKSKQSIYKKLTIFFSKLLFKLKTNFLLFFQYRYIKKLKTYYETIALKEIDFDKKYIYYCLHFDPEANTIPKDNIHSNQLLNIRILASAIPDDWVIYVKEHPHQLEYQLYKDIFQNQLHSIDNFRSKKYYEYINSLDKVRLASLKSDHRELTLNSQFIASNTGTIFREAGSLGKLCLTFSKKTIYTLLDNVHYISDSNSAKMAIQNCNKKEESEYDNVDKLFGEYSITINELSKRDSKLLFFINSSKIYRLNND